MTPEKMDDAMPPYDSQASPLAPGLGRTAARGVASTAITQGARLLLQVASVVALARLLVPSDYGLVSMVLVIIGVAEVFRDLGLSSAAIQAPALSRSARSNLFWLNSASGLILSLMVAAASPLIAALYARPEVIYISLALAPSFLLSGLATQHRAHLIRQHRFGAAGLVDLSCAAFGLGVGIFVALLGGGFWALVAQQISASALGTVLVVILAGWLPSKYDRATSVRPFLAMGAAVLLSQLLAYASNNIDSFVVGTNFGAAKLGLYNRGVQLVRSPLNMVRAPISVVALPILSRLQDDRQRFMEFAERGQLLIAYPVLLGIGWIVSISPKFVELTLGDAWLGAAPVISCIAIGEGLSTLMFIASTMYVSLGLVQELLRFSIFTTIVRICLLIAAIPFGLVGVAAAYAIGPLVVFPLAIWQLARVTKLPTWRLFAQGAQIVLVAALASTFTWAAMRPLSQLSPAIFVGVSAVVQLGATLVLAAHPTVRRHYLMLVRSLKLLRRPDTRTVQVDI